MEHYNNGGPNIVKQLAGLISLASFCAGAALVEYEIAWRVGGAFILLAGACGLAVVSRALYTAPEGDERADGFHIRRLIGGPAFAVVRPVQHRVQRQWTQ